MLADFFYTLRDAGFAIYAAPPIGFPSDHYAQKHPLPPGPGEVLYVTHAAAGLTCRAPAVAPREVASWTPEAGLRHQRPSASTGCRGAAGSPDG